MPNAIAPVTSAITTLRSREEPAASGSRSPNGSSARGDLDPLLVGVERVEVAARGLAYRGALGRAAPDPDLLTL